MPTDDFSHNWVTDACTLPTVERPQRVAEFDDLFRTGLRGLERTAPTRLRLRLDPAAEAQARELTSRESDCCSFFTFTYSSTEDALVLDVEVPASQVGVLDALTARVNG